MFTLVLIRLIGEGAIGSGFTLALAYFFSPMCPICYLGASVTLSIWQTGIEGHKMSPEITADQVEIAFHEAAAGAARAKSDVERKVTPLTLAKDLWSVSRKLSNLLQAYAEIEHYPLPGMSIQRIEKDLCRLTQMLGDVLEACKKKGLDRHWAIKAVYFSLLSKNERLKDYWVAFYSSTDHELQDRLKEAEMEESVSWDSVRQ